MKKTIMFIISTILSICLCTCLAYAASDSASFKQNTASAVGVYEKGKTPVGASKPKLAFLGDSITFGYQTTKKYHEYLADKFDIIAANCGYSGSCIGATGPNGEPSFAARVSQIPDDCDAIIVLGGINDFGQCTTVSFEEYKSGLRTLMSMLKAKFEGKPIIFFSPLQNGGWYPTDKNAMGLTLNRYTEEMEIACNEYEIPFVDCTNEDTFKKFNKYDSEGNIIGYDKAYYADGLHPNAEGHEVMANFFQQKLFEHRIITLIDENESFYLSERLIRLAKGSTHSLGTMLSSSYSDTKPIVYTSSEPEIASVDKYGMITALKVGTSYVSANFNGISSICKVIVLENEIAPLEFLSKKIVANTTPIEINCLGDSITVFAQAPYQGMNYHDWWNKCYYVQNNDYGIWGTTVGSFVNRCSKMSASADLITVKGGTNDWTSFSLGKLTDRTSDTFYGSLRLLAETLIAKYPEKQIVFFTPIRRCDNSRTVDTVNKYGNTLRDFSIAVKEIAAIYGIPAVDLYDAPTLDFTTDKKRHYMPDGVHPTGEGHSIIAEYMLEKLEDLGVVRIITDRESLEIPYARIDCELIAADKLLKIADTDSCAIAPLKIDDKDYLRITSGKYIESTDNTAVTFDFEKISRELSATDYRFALVEYRTNMQSNNAEWKLGIEATSGSTLISADEVNFNPSRDDTHQFAVIALDKSNSEQSGYISKFIIKPWGGNINYPWGGNSHENISQDHLDIIKIGFFKSYAEAMTYVKFRTEKNIIGDINGDGTADTADAYLMLKSVSGCSGYYTSMLNETCDLYLDERFNVKDVLCFARQLAGWRGYETLPIKETGGADESMYSPNICP